MSKIVDNLYKKVRKDKGEQRPFYQEIGEGLVNQADVLYLPEDDKGYKYLLVVVDNGSRKVDFEPLKTHSSNSIVKAFEKIYKRGILKKPGIIQVDAGKEFQGETKNWMKRNNIFLRVGQVNRHRQVALAEAVNKIIGKYIFKKQLEVELITGKEYKNWVRYLNEIRDKINERASKRKIKKIKGVKPIFHKGQLLKVGQKVRVALDGPINHLTRQPLGGRFRETDIRWDPKVRTVMSVVVRPNYPVMYYLNDPKNKKKILRVGYTRNQLQIVDKDEEYPSKDVLEDENLDEYVVEKVLQHKRIGNKLMLKVKWAGWPVNQSTWEDVKDLKHLDVVKDYLEEKFDIKI